MGRPSNSEVRRNQIVTAFMKVMARKGFSGASIQEIATEAELTPGLIHYHFKSKLEILMTLFMRLESLVQERFQARIDGSSRLHALIDAFLALDHKSDELAIRSWMMIGAEAMINPELQELYRQVVERQLSGFEGAIQDALASKRMTPTIQEIAAAVLAAIHGSFLLAATAPGLIPKGSAAESVKGMVDGLLREAIQSRG